MKSALSRVTSGKMAAVVVPVRPLGLGFTILELLVAMAVLALMSVLMVSVVGSSQRMSKQALAGVGQFREARRAFERIEQTLSQATLNVYWDYVDADGNPRPAVPAAPFVPTGYFRQSELRYRQFKATALTAPRGGTMKGMALFFQAPLGRTGTAGPGGMNALLNTVGYFVERGDDMQFRPPLIQASKTRYRLFELLQPSESFSIYKNTSGAPTDRSSDWIEDPLSTPAFSHPLAENVVALVFRAEYPDSSDKAVTAFDYDSTPVVRPTPSQPVEENNLPMSVRITMVVLDEDSARRVEDRGIALPDAHDEASLNQLESELRQNRLTYRRMDSSVSIGPAKWSR